jgi:hypothetical protein
MSTRHDLNWYGTIESNKHTFNMALLIVYLFATFFCMKKLSYTFDKFSTLLELT